MEAPVVEVNEALRLDLPPGSDGAAGPPGDAAFARATPARFPDVWNAARRAQAESAWYRASVELPAPPTVPWAVYLPRAVMRADVWLNHVRIGGSSGRNTNRPLLVVFPPGSLRAGPNTVDVRLHAQPTYLSSLDTFMVGPAAILRPWYEARTFWQVTVLEWGFVLNLCLGVMCFALAIRRSDLPGFAESSIACILWAIGTLELFVRTPPFPPLVWQWITTSALAASIAALVIGAHRFLALGRPRLERAVVAVFLAGSTAFAVGLTIGPRTTDGIVAAWAVATAATGAYLVRLLLIIGESRTWSLRVAAPIGLLGFAAGLHDVALGTGLPIFPRILLIPFLGSLMPLWVGWRVTNRFADALDESQTLNRDLERRVDERGREIARGYEQIRRLERDRAVQDERDRLMRDIHDGFGGQLSSMLALVEKADVTGDEVAEALRDALDDMRLVVSSLAPVDADLIGLLANWRARIERRLGRHGLRFDWQVSDLPPLPWLGPREALHVLRIFQEAVSNVVQHAGATTITVRTGARPASDGRAGVFVEVQDDGRGLASVGVDGAGSGLGNMNRRAADVGGSVAVDGGPHGTLIVLWLPIDGPAC
jgi:signal transduction histidine kinase